MDRSTPTHLAFGNRSNTANALTPGPTPRSSTLVGEPRWLATSRQCARQEIPAHTRVAQSPFEQPDPGDELPGPPSAEVRLKAEVEDRRNQPHVYVEGENDINERFDFASGRNVMGRQ